MRMTIVAAAVACVVSACGASLDTNDGGPRLTDAPACGCRIERQEGGYEALVMSWSCFCSASDCTRDAYACETAPRTRYLACGVTVASFSGPAGWERWVYDESGVLVGREAAAEPVPFTCPDNPTLQSASVRAGRFPEASCVATACGCAGGVATCDGGVRDD